MAAEHHTGALSGRSIQAIRAALDGGKPSKVIYVRDKLINLVP